MCNGTVERSHRVFLLGWGQLFGGLSWVQEHVTGAAKSIHRSARSAALRISKSVSRHSHSSVHTDEGAAHLSIPASIAEGQLAPESTAEVPSLDGSATVGGGQQQEGVAAPLGVFAVDVVATDRGTRL